MLVVGVALVLAIFALPSALNLPQANPAQTLEYAPVPGNANASAAGGNFAGLGLGTGGAAAGDGGLAGPGVASLLSPLLGSGTHPSDKACVGNPPRQTEDPLSPPCVAYFAGDNGGATYQGVTGREVRVVFALDINVGRRADDGFENEQPYTGQYYDLAKPLPANVQSVSLRNLQRFMRYFNARYQTYNRLVHFYAFFTNDNNGRLGVTISPEERKADAADNYNHLHPFAAMTTQLEFGLGQDYSDAMAQRGVLGFGSDAGNQDQSVYQRYPGLIWSFLPTVQEQARIFSSWVCQKVVGQVVRDSGNTGENGGPRRLGFISTTDDTRPGLVQFAALAKSQVQACGGEFVDSRTFPTVSVDPQTGAYGTTNMASFQSNHVTTVVWAGGYEVNQMSAADSLHYYPEWILGGDRFSESEYGGQQQDQLEEQRAWIATSVTRVGLTPQTLCGEALREVDPGIGTQDLFWGCSDAPWYDDIRQLFTGIQVAGPRLTPKSLDQGFHAIPGVASPDPAVPACFYAAGDYTCVKDAQEEHWDATGRDPNSSAPGCWRMLEEGRRYLVGQWPAGNVDSRSTQSDPCNLYDKTAP